MKSPNFSFLEKHDPLLVTCAASAEKYLFDDPNTALIKLRQFVEILAQQAAAYAGVYTSSDDSLTNVLEALWDRGVLTPEVSQIFHNIRKAGNAAAHQHTGTRKEALENLRMARTLAIWFHKSFGNDPAFHPGPFVPPPDPKDVEQELGEELNRLRQKLFGKERETEKALKAFHEEAMSRKDFERRAALAYAELDAALELAKETEDQLLSERERFRQNLEALQEETGAKPTQVVAAVVEQAYTFGQTLDLDEADTRKIIDAQLREAGLEADSQSLTFNKGTRPHKGKNVAIAEWPTLSGPADYVLFAGLTPIGVVEAKRKIKDVPGSIGQSKRVSRDYKVRGEETLPGGPWKNCKIPFLFATNGRPFLRQLAVKSGIWFLDARFASSRRFLG